MIEVLVKTLIPILLLTVVELVFFFVVAIKDIDKDFSSFMKQFADKLFKTEESKMINGYVLNILEKINERTLVCSESSRQRYNKILLFNGVYLVFILLLVIVLLLLNMKIEGSMLEWWIATIIESLLLVGLLGYFQFTFLEEIIKNKKFKYFTDSEIKLKIYENVLKLKTPTL